MSWDFDTYQYSRTLDRNDHLLHPPLRLVAGTSFPCFLALLRSIPRPTMRLPSIHSTI